MTDQSLVVRKELPQYTMTWGRDHGYTGAEGMSQGKWWCYYYCPTCNGWVAGMPELNDGLYYCKRCNGRLE